MKQASGLVEDFKEKFHLTNLVISKQFLLLKRHPGIWENETFEHIFETLEYIEFKE